MRYLAELPWNPDAILHNGTLRWTEDGPDNFLVSPALSMVSAEVKLTMDGNRRIVEASAPDRPREVNGKFVPTPWLGRFFGYERRQGRLIPMRAEVAWIIEGVETICWEGRIEDWRTG
jgi:hypothetical protein